MARHTHNDTLYEQVVKELRTRIMTGVYKKGDPLPSEKDLIESMGVSRITVRKAVSMLAQAGLIQTSQGKKSIVIFDSSDLSGDATLSEYTAEYIENFRAAGQIRLMLEPEVARQVALIAADEDIARLEASLRGGKYARKAGVSEDFHREMFAILNNKELLKIYDNLITLEEGNAPNGVIAPDKQEEISALVDMQHDKILDSIRNHNGEYAYFYMKEHTQYICDMYEKHFDFFFNN